MIPRICRLLKKSSSPRTPKRPWNSWRSEKDVGKRNGGPTEFQIYAADPEAQAAACLVVMKEKDKDIMLGARIKLERRQDHRSRASGRSRRWNESKCLSAQWIRCKKPDPVSREDMPKAEQMKREDLIRIGLSYYDALTSEDGTRAPFATECERRENGMTTAGGPPRQKTAPGGAMPTGGFGGAPRDCEGQLSAGVFSYITEIKPRMVVADVQKGLSIGFSMFRHDGTKRLPKDAPPGTSNKTQYGNSTWPRCTSTKSEMAKSMK